MHWHCIHSVSRHASLPIMIYILFVIHNQIVIIDLLPDWFHHIPFLLNRSYDLVVAYQYGWNTTVDPSVLLARRQQLLSLLQKHFSIIPNSALLIIFGDDLCPYSLFIIFLFSQSKVWESRPDRQISVIAILLGTNLKAMNYQTRYEVNFVYGTYYSRIVLCFWRRRKLDGNICNSGCNLISIEFSDN